ncbi:Ail/Lom family outer membrane beta-barrel protein [Serratia microhaemolytica]|uniref:Ail/Lom family outer membrane beta-barrel protein n=1 Tax=Serratia microhaemolytica TaxID=2675110 RepID=UPI000FDD6E56|nr:Ail/Lom family outer membrane beta-barrel protein [Serratia microhaemolytica]
MKKLLAALVVSATLGLAATAHAEQHTVSLGYASGKIEKLHDISGANLKYRYEWDSPISIVGSFSYMSGSSIQRTEAEALYEKLLGEANLKTKYLSLAAGPAYRFNEYVSIYSLVGFSNSKVSYDTSFYIQNNGVNELTDTTKGDFNNTTVMYGVGVQINPMPNVAVDIGYEGSRLKDGFKSYAINSFNIGVGYRF